MNPAVIRPATPADIPAFAAIYAQAVLHTTASFELMPPDAAEMRRRYDAITGRGLPYLAAERDGAIAGYAYAGPYHHRAGYRFTVEDSIYLAPEAQRAGIGRALLARLIAETEALGYRQMIAVIGDSAHHGSIALHRAAGFRPAGTLTATGFKFGRWIDTVLMQRPLGPGSDTLPAPAPPPGDA